MWWNKHAKQINRFNWIMKPNWNMKSGLKFIFAILLATIDLTPLVCRYWSWYAILRELQSITLTFFCVEHTFESIVRMQISCVCMLDLKVETERALIFFGRLWSNVSARFVVHSIKRSSCRFLLALATILILTFMCIDCIALLLLARSICSFSLFGPQASIQLIF